ncbi:MAG: D-alanyl-D-alanine carboxypeptidase/D-alanyl-D-alanine-endopeptidase [Candidatus Margulisbacteria bacterium]|nr:D-alanyl-D-alanine carboxypeptidase/D-alanyl-D-alanine-endopeptidase [Candidatus Margulisiibacteriota bacterium]
MKKLRQPIIWPILIILALLFAAYAAYLSIKTSSRGGKLSPGIRALMNEPGYKQASWGLLAVDRRNGKMIADFNSEKLFVPASTTKLFTVAAALHVLGKDHLFKTPVYQLGSIDKNGALYGDLVLVASGDITLGGRRNPDGTMAYTSMDHTDANSINGATLTPTKPLAGLDNLARQVADTGIKRIRGEIIIDARIFPQGQPTNSDADYVLSPIMINDNLIDFIIKPTEPGNPALVVWQPFTEFYDFDVLVNTVAPGKSSQIIITSPEKRTIQVRGQIAADQAQLVRTYQVKDPTAYGRALFIEALEQAGIVVDASLRKNNPTIRLPDKEKYAELKKIAEYTSLPFSEYAKMILKVSHNPGADTLLYLIANKQEKKSFADGLAIEKEFLSQAKVDLKAVFLGDGQGGVREDLISPKAAVELLRYMAKRPDFETYHLALPILGVDGSLASMARPNSPVRGKVQAKTGTTILFIPMNETPFLLSKGLAGYLTTKKGREVAFAFYVNNVNMSQAKNFDDILDFVTRAGTDLGKICEAIYLEN